MKRVINGKRFDTDKAIEVGRSGSSGLSRNDFHYWEAVLYRTPRAGSYFLAGQGHALTVFAHQSDDGSRSWGERIIPLSAADALQWAEQNLPADEVEGAFPDLITDA